MNRYIRTNDFSKNRYILYARKSSESEDRQVASVTAQIEEMNSVAKEFHLNVVEVITGFKTGRKEFNMMLSKVQNNEADGILVWKISRLSRNPDDAGRIMGMLQRKEIKHIRTFNKDWLPDDNVMMLYVEFGITNQFSRDLSDDTMRGLLAKAKRGWSPVATLPLGYMHSPYKKVGEKEILVDQKRFNIVQNSLRKVASGEMRPLEALEYANAMGLTTKKGKSVSESTFYRTLTDTFYYGKFEFPRGSGNWFDGKHKKAITEEEYDLIKKYKGNNTVRRPQKHLFPYTGMMKCGECGLSITVDPKVKVQKNGNVHKYAYYRCTKSRGNCTQRAVERKVIEKQFKEMLSNITISEAFHEWALEELEKEVKKDIKSRAQILKTAQEKYDLVVDQINELVKGYVAKVIPENAYNTNLKELQKEQKKYKRILDNTDESIYEWTDNVRKAVHFSKTAKDRFGKATDIHTKNDIMLGLGTNFVIKDKRVSLEIERPLIIVKEASDKFDEELQRLEPLKWMEDREEMKTSMAKNPVWGG